MEAQCRLTLPSRGPTKNCAFCGPLMSNVRPHMATIQPLMNPDDHDWVILIGRYILNMGSVEASTRLLITIHEGNDRAKTMNADLPSRIGFLRGRFPRNNTARHSWAMNVFNVAGKHVGFRNIIAHSPLVITEHQDGSHQVQGILNLTPNDERQAGELVGLEELRGRVNESAKLGEQFLQMQEDFKGKSAA
jgi:hypothetical protein